MSACSFIAGVKFGEPPSSSPSSTTLMFHGKVALGRRKAVDRREERDDRSLVVGRRTPVDAQLRIDRAADRLQIDARVAACRPPARYGAPCVHSFGVAGLAVVVDVERQRALRGRRRLAGVRPPGCPWSRTASPQTRASRTSRSAARRSCGCRPDSTRDSAARSAETARRGSASRSSSRHSRTFRTSGVGAADNAEKQRGDERLQIHARSIQSRAHGILRRERGQHRRSPPDGEAPAAADGVRLHRRRRGARVDAARKHARVRGRDVPAAIGGRDRELRSQDHGARLADRSAVDPRARRQQPDVLSARRRGSGLRSRRGRHDLHACRRLSGCTMEDVKARHGGQRLVSALSGRRPRRGAEGDRAREGLRLQGAGRHHRYAGGRHARARCAQRRQATAREELSTRPVSRPDDRAARAGCAPSSATAA